MRDTILEKLKRELGKSVLDECQVVFVLSRIRKYLEKVGSKGDYLHLKFYCDWALHTQIDRTERLESVLEEVKKCKKDNEGDVLFLHFGNELVRFCKNNEIACKWITSPEWKKLNHILNDIYSETPIIVKYPLPKQHLEEEIRIKKEPSGLKIYVSPLDLVDG